MKKITAIILCALFALTALAACTDDMSYDSYPEQSKAVSLPESEDIFESSFVNDESENSEIIPLPEIESSEEESEVSSEESLDESIEVSEESAVSTEESEEESLRPAPEFSSPYPESIVVYDPWNP